MRATLLFSSLLLLCLSMPLSGQTPQSTFQIQLGVSPYWVYDQAASPFVYRTILPQAGFQFRRDGEKHVWDASLRGGSGSSKSLGTSPREIRFMTRDVYDDTDTFDVLLGGQLMHANLQLGWAYRLSPSWAIGLRAGDEMYYAQGFVTPGLMNFAWAGPQVEFAKHFGEKNYLRARLAVPVVAFVHRLPYHGSVSLPEKGQVAGFFKQNLSVYTLDKFQRASLELEYQRRLSQRLSLGIALDYSALAMNGGETSVLRAGKQSAMITLTIHPKTGLKD